MASEDIEQTASSVHIFKTKKIFDRNEKNSNQTNLKNVKVSWSWSVWLEAATFCGSSCIQTDTTWYVYISSKFTRENKNVHSLKISHHLVKQPELLTKNADLKISSWWKNTVHVCSNA